MAKRISQNKAKFDYDSDELFENPQEKLKLQSLPEVEREKIINEKVLQLVDRREREELLRGKIDYQKSALDDIKVFII